MNFSIARIIRRALAPRHEISCPQRVWDRLLDGLRERGRHERESGAFLLGKRVGNTARINNFVLYDDLDPNCLNTGIVRFDGRYYGKLWDLCARTNSTVVADVHTHPSGSAQSGSDRENPMIATAGHIAFILPNFARDPVPMKDVGIYRYCGGRRWQSIVKKYRSSFFHIGF